MFGEMGEETSASLFPFAVRIILAPLTDFPCALFFSEGTVQGLQKSFFPLKFE